VAAQRLARKLCEECKQPMKTPPRHEHLIQVGFAREDLKDLELYEPLGCSRCEKGYKGRFALLETMRMSNELQRIVIDGGSALDIKNMALEQGMITLRRCGVLNVLRGKTSLEEVLRVTVGD
jgi:type IV pilus assembly protein PilB